MASSQYGVPFWQQQQQQQHGHAQIEVHPSNTLPPLPVPLPGMSTSTSTFNSHYPHAGPAPSLAGHLDPPSGTLLSGSENDHDSHEHDGNTRKRKSTAMSGSVDHDDGNAASGSGTKKKQRNRAVLSCIPCKSRKIKCDRRQPCSSCIRRNMGDQCRWEDRAQTGAPQPFATMSEVDVLRARLETVEALIARVPQHLLEPASVDPKAESDIDGEKSNDGEEAAVGALESLALGHPFPAEQNGGMFKTRLARASVYHQPPKIETSASGHPYAASALDPVTLEAQSTTRTQSTIILPSPIRGHGIAPVTDYLRDEAPSAVLRSVLKALPRREIADTLLDYYFAIWDWTDMCVSERTFRRECRDFWDHVNAQKSLELVDPAWLALFFIKLACAARQMPATHLKGQDPAIIAVLPDQFHLASKRCLELANDLNHPSFRHLQTLASMCLYVWYGACRTEGLILLASAVRIAQFLGLGTLGEDQTTMPNFEDIAFPTGPSVLKRQLACRLWANLMFLDNTFSSIQSMTIFYPVRGATTAEPLNLNDADLYTNELVVQERPLTERTDMSFQLIRNELVKTWRFLDSDAKHTYEEVLEVDKQLRELFGRLSQDPGKDIQVMSASLEGTSMQKAVFISGLSAQLVRLHNPYYIRAFKQPKYAYSHEACLSAAATVLDANLAITSANVGERFWFMHLHVFSAAMTLLLDLMHCVDSNAPNAHKVLEERFRQAEIAATVFADTEKTRVETAARVGRIGGATVKAVLSAARERQHFRQKGDPRAKESYAETFRRIVDQISEQSAKAVKSETKSAPSVPSRGTQRPPSYAQPAPAQAASNLPLPPQLEASNATPYGYHMPSIDTSAQGLLRSLGVNLDSLYNESPNSSHSSTANGRPHSDENRSAVPSAGQAGLDPFTWSTDYVFDDLFGNSSLGQETWNTGSHLF